MWETQYGGMDIRCGDCGSWDQNWVEVEPDGVIYAWFRTNQAFEGAEQFKDDNIPWYKRGTAPDSEVKLAVRAVVAAAEDAEIDVRDIDGFVSWVPSRTAART